LYLNPSGVLPDAAVITKGVRRENPFRERRVFDMTSFTGHAEVETKIEDDDDEEGAGMDKRHLEETEG
jgi:tRNA pseudouridine38-40 synthase